ncbi:MAG: NAD-binding protein [Actinomycetota bacterium]
MRAVVVGAGASARDLIKRLGDPWTIIVVDTDPGRLDIVSDMREVETVLGDGSSAVVLRAAGIERAISCVAATGSDDVNLEVSRLAKDAGVEQVIAVVRVPDRSVEYRDVGAETITPARLAAHGLEVAMEPRKLTSTTFAEGKAEAIEFEIAPDSPVQGMALHELHSAQWVVAAVLRDDELVVPHGDTVLLSGDRVTVVGAASDFSQVVRTFAGGVSRFPLEFGRKVVVVLADAADRALAVNEAAYFVRNTNAEELVVVHRDVDTIKNQAEAAEFESLLASTTTEQLGVEVRHRPVHSNPDDARVTVASRESVGAIVVEMPNRSRMRPYARIPAILTDLAPSGVPILFTRGDASFARIIAPVTRTPSGDVACRAAIDIARRSGSGLTGVSVASPTFMGSDDMVERRAATAWLHREAAVHDVDSSSETVRGNPVKAISAATAHDTLLVLSMPTFPMSRVRPGTGVWAAARAKGSVLFVPSGT